MITISHHFNGFEGVDRVLVLEGGRIVEEGPRTGLARGTGRYARLRRMQVEAYTS